VEFALYSHAWCLSCQVEYSALMIATFNYFLEYHNIFRINNLYDSCSLGYSTVTFMASYNNYPGGYALKALHEAGEGYMTTVEYMKRQHLCSIVKLQVRCRRVYLLKNNLSLNKLQAKSNKLSTCLLLVAFPMIRYVDNKCFFVGRYL
jgi:hypothetical protein